MQAGNEVLTGIGVTNFDNFENLQIDQRGRVTLRGSNSIGTLSGSGVLDVNNGGTLAIGSAGRSTGPLYLSQALLDLGATGAAGAGKIILLGNATLQVEAGGTVANTIANFGVGDTIDVRGLVGGTVALNGNLLTLSNATTTDSFVLAAGPANAAGLVVSSDDFAAPRSWTRRSTRSRRARPASETLTFSDVSAAALAADLDAVQLVSTVTSPLGTYADTVTATITDTAFEPATLISTATLTIAPQPTDTATTLQITTPAEASDDPNQTIGGTARFITAPIGAGGQAPADGDLADATIILLDDGAEIGTAATNADGQFSTNVTLPFTGANILTLSTLLPASTSNNTELPPNIVSVVDTLLPPPAVIGSGSSTLALSVSGRGQSGGAQFSISVDGVQVGGVQTTTADILQGQSQEFDLLGNFVAGAHTVSIDYLNPANSLLLVDNATIDGAAIGNSATTLNNGSASFGFTAPGSATATIGTGSDTLLLTASEQGHSKERTSPSAWTARRSAAPR